MVQYIPPSPNNTIDFSKATHAFEIACLFTFLYVCVSVRLAFILANELSDAMNRLDSYFIKHDSIKMHFSFKHKNDVLRISWTHFFFATLTFNSRCAKKMRIQINLRRKAKFCIKYQFGVCCTLYNKSRPSSL